MNRMLPHKTAGLLSLLAAFLALCIWYILLFVAQPAGVPVSVSAAETMRYLLIEEESSRHWFIWLAVVPVVSSAIGVCYLAGVARTKKLALALFALTLALGVSSFFLLNWSLALFVLLPGYWGGRCVRQAQYQR